jgi:hypothetical protein
VIFEARIMPGAIWVIIWPELELVLDIVPDGMVEAGGGDAWVLVAGGMAEGALESDGALVWAKAAAVMSAEAARPVARLIFLISSSKVRFAPDGRLRGEREACA